MIIVSRLVLHQHLSVGRAPHLIILSFRIQILTVLYRTQVYLHLVRRVPQVVLLVMMTQVSYYIFKSLRFLEPAHPALRQAFQLVQSLA